MLHITLLEHAKKLGFASLGVIPVNLMEKECEYLDLFLKHSYNGTMEYMRKNRDIRENPELLLKGAKSIIVVLVPYKPAVKQNQDKIGIASYAYGKDYHYVIKERLKLLACTLKEYDNNVNYRVFTDSAPIFERSMAVKAGLGFIGKNNFLISKEHGLHTFIGIIITNIEMEYTSTSAQIQNLCGSCTRCLDACPTGALVAPFRIDARKCISYKTIESKEEYDISDKSDSRAGMMFGCDICMDVCPWARKAQVGNWVDFSPLMLKNGCSIIDVPSSYWLELDKETFKEEFKQSPLFRAGLDKIKNNVRHELANKS
ncbi:MAG: tRNA epoxyqueuosine(34) reductase QueG [Bacteroidales bacterium]